MYMMKSGSKAAVKSSKPKAAAYPVKRNVGKKK